MSKLVDQLIAEALFCPPNGCNVDKVDCKSYADGNCPDINKPPAYSTLDSAALEGIKTLAEKYGIKYTIHGIGGGKTELVLWKHVNNKHVSSSAISDSLAAALEGAMVEKFCQYPGSPVKAGICDGQRNNCGTCKDGVVRIKPALKEALKGAKNE